MALQVLIYKKLNRQDMLQWDEFFYGKIGKGYQRAWDIVNKTEGPQPFIDEIKRQN